MSDAVDLRRAYMGFIEGHALVEDVDFTRDSYRTLVVELGDPAELESALDWCPACGKSGLRERLEGHECRRFKFDASEKERKEDTDV